MNRESHFDFDTLLVHSAFVRRLARSLVRDGADAEDLAQDAYVAAIRYADDDRHEIASPRGLLGTIVWKLARRGEHRSRLRARHELSTERPGDVSQPAEIAEREALRRRVIEAVLALDEPYRHTVIARYLDDLGTVAIAARDGVPVETVRTRLKRATEKLRAKLDAECGDGAWRAGLAPFAGALHGSSAPLVAGWFAAKGSLSITLTATAVVLSAALLWRSTRTESGSAIPDAPALVVASLDTEADATEAMVAEPLEAAARAEVPASPDGNANDPVLVGRCVDEKEEPITGAVVTLEEAEYSPRSGRSSFKVLATTTADAAGAFSLVEPAFVKTPDRWPARFVFARAPGRVTTRTSLKREEEVRGRIGDIVLQPGATVRGVVLDEDDHPVANALVEMGADRGMNNAWWRSGAHDSFRLAESRTGPAGEFVFEGVPADWAYVYAQSPQGMFFRSDPVAVLVGDATPRVVVRVRHYGPENRIVVLARDEDGAPLPRARIRTMETRRESSSSTFAFGGESVADDAGRCEWLVDEGYWFDFDLIDAFGVLATAKEVRGGGDPVELIAKPHRFVTLRVRDPDGKVPPAVTVELLQESHSMYELPVVKEHDEWKFAAPHGKFTIDIDCPGFVSQQLGPFDDQAVVPERLEVDLVRAAGIHGIVRAEGKPLAGAWLRTFSDSEDRVVTRGGLRADWWPAVFDRPDASNQAAQKLDAAISASDGRYQLSASRAGRYRVCAEADGFAPSWFGPFEIDPVTTNLELDVTLDQGGAIEGRVTRSDGVSPAGQFVVASWGDDRAVHAKVQDDGSYRLERLAAGDYEIALRSEPADGSVRVGGRGEGDRPARKIDATVVAGKVAHHDFEAVVPAVHRITGKFQVARTSRFDLIASIESPDTSLDFEQDLFSLQRECLMRGHSSLSQADPLDSSGEFDLTGSATGELRLVIQPREQSDRHARYDFPLRVEGPLTRRDVDLEVGSIEVKLPESVRHLPNSAFVLWRGEHGEFAIFSSSPENRAYRFTDVPVGKVIVQVGARSKREESAVRANETTTIDWK